jgi:RNA polymerase sigma factor (TIGR02999 family)
MPVQRGEVTDLLIDWSRGDTEALRRLMPLVFDELRRLARSHLRHERDEHTLQPTALVHEVYMRLVEQRRVDWQNRSQFFAFASTLMRRILVDYAKARGAAKRGAGVPKVALDESIEAAGGFNVDLLALDRALDELAALDARQARIVEMRFFAGLNHHEIAEVLGTSHTTVKREWRSARLWLYQRLSGGP